MWFVTGDFPCLMSDRGAGIPRASRTLGISLCLALSGCLHAAPEPAAEQRSQQTIYAVVQIRPFQDASPSQDKAANLPLERVRPATSPEGTPSDVAQAVTQAVLVELRKHAAFEEVGLHPHNPDLVLSGTIYRFSEQVASPHWASIPVIGVLGKILGLNVEQVSSEVTLEMVVTKPRGEVMRRYRGRAAFEEKYSVYERIDPGSLLNEALIEALAQIRRQLLQDRRQLMTNL